MKTAAFYDYGSWFGFAELHFERFHVTMVPVGNHVFYYGFQREKDLQTL